MSLDAAIYFGLALGWVMLNLTWTIRGPRPGTPRWVAPLWWFLSMLMAPISLVLGLVSA